MYNYQGKKVLIFGLGLNGGGVGSAKFFAKLGSQVRITDLKKKDVLKGSIDQLLIYPAIEYTLGQHKYEDIEWADLIIKNPGVKPNNPYLTRAQTLGKRIEQDIGIFLEFVSSNQLIGVTGTKGKSTTAHLINHILQTAGKDVLLCGNIGKSVLDLIITTDQGKLSRSIIVLELSSFQLESFQSHKLSPHWAVLTNIYPDHLNYYSTMQDYLQAKRVIGLFQKETDYLFINKLDPNLNNDLFLRNLAAQKIFFSSTDQIPVYNATLLGDHNKANMAAALAVARNLQISDETTFSALNSFKGVPFRMELIAEIEGVKIINNTTATTPMAAIESLKTFPFSTLICGGMNKGMDYREFAEIVGKYCKAVYFLEGDATEEIKKHLDQMKSHISVKINKTYNNLVQLLTDIKPTTVPGDLILFSPAATSFNLFQNEFDRGHQFNQAVRQVFNINP